MKVLLIILASLLGIIGLVVLGLVIAAQRRRPKSTKKGFTKLEYELLKKLLELFNKDIKQKLKLQLVYFEDKTLGQPSYLYTTLERRRIQ